MKKITCEYCGVEDEYAEKDTQIFLDSFWMKHDDCVIFHYIKKVTMKEGQVSSYDNTRIN